MLVHLLHLCLFLFSIYSSLVLPICLSFSPSIHQYPYQVCSQFILPSFSSPSILFIYLFNSTYQPSVLVFPAVQSVIRESFPIPQLVPTLCSLFYFLSSVPPTLFFLISLIFHVLLISPLSPSLPYIPAPSLPLHFPFPCLHSSSLTIPSFTLSTFSSLTYIPFPYLLHFTLSCRHRKIMEEGKQFKGREGMKGLITNT